jgi:hypothetical protein
LVDDLEESDEPTKMVAPNQIPPPWKQKYK